MQTSHLHRYAWAAAVLTLLLVITGAVVTSNGQQGTPQQVHRVMAAAVGLLTIGLAFWLARISDRLRFRKLGWTALALVIVQAAVGMLAPSAAAIHAILAQVFFGLMVAIVVVTSAGWGGIVELIEDRMRPPLSTIANLTLAMVLVQIVLGAAVRHKLLGVMSHIGFAVLVALAALMLGMCVLHQAPEHRVLRPAAIHLMVLIGVQVFLGFAAFIMRIMSVDTTLAANLVTTAHVTTAALTLGATVLLKLGIQRYMKAGLPQRVVAS